MSMQVHMNIHPVHFQITELLHLKQNSLASLITQKDLDPHPLPPILKS